MSIGVVIVNFKTVDLTIECLRSLASAKSSETFDVIIVDNDSQDGSYEKIDAFISANQWSNWSKVIKSGANGGFSYGNNVAIRDYLNRSLIPEFIYLLNPDAYIREGAISALVSFLRTHPNAGIAGSRLENPDGTPQESSFRFHTVITELDRGFSLGILTKALRPWVNSYNIPERAEKTDWVSGASMMIRSEVFQQIGLLDEAYFMYYEETDFCLQASRAGWECWYVPESKVVHHVGQSTGITKAIFKRLPSYWFDSRRRYFLKNYGVTHLILADLFWLIGFASWRFRNLFQRKQHNHPPHLLLDSFLNSFLFQGVKLLPTKNK